jgi:hypothetical protein
LRVVFELVAQLALTVAQRFLNPLLPKQILDVREVLIKPCKLQCNALMLTALQAGAALR